VAKKNKDSQAKEYTEIKNKTNTALHGKEQKNERDYKTQDMDSNILETYHDKS